MLIYLCCELSAFSRLVKLPWRKQNKTLKYSGKPYINADGVARQGRSMRPPCNEACRQNCWKKITQSQRQRIFDAYYNLADLHQQWQYLGRYMDKTVPKQKIRLRGRTKDVRTQQTRRNNVRYYLQTDTERLNVCKRMFLATFDISHRVSVTVANKTNDHGVLVAKDGRGSASRCIKQETLNQKQLDNPSSSSEKEPDIN